MSNKIHYTNVAAGSSIALKPVLPHFPEHHVFNEMYARDISRKIKASLQVRMEEGAYIGNFAPYGYQKSHEDKHLLVPSPETAPNVQQIFREAAAGTLPRQIAETLNARNILPPSLYRCRNNTRLNPGNYTVHGVWTANTIIKILHNPVYLGHMVQGKSQKISFKSSLTLSVPPSQRIAVLHTHQALIAQEEFDECQSQLDQRATRNRTGQPRRNAFH